MKQRHAKQFAKRTLSVKADPFQFGGSWTNELGSKMELSVGAAGEVTGHYQSAVSDIWGTNAVV